jgi:hypothetical protein
VGSVVILVIFLFLASDMHAFPCLSIPLACQILCAKHKEMVFDVQNHDGCHVFRGLQ